MDVVGIIVQGHGLLLLQRGPHDSCPLQWCIPGGKVEDESLMDAARRELLEETGITTTLVPAGTREGVTHDGKPFVIHLFETEYYGPIKLEPGFVGYGWFNDNIEFMMPAKELLGAHWEGA